MTILGGYNCFTGLKVLKIQDKSVHRAFGQFTWTRCLDIKITNTNVDKAALINLGQCFSSSFKIATYETFQLFLGSKYLHGTKNNWASANILSMYLFST